MLVAGRRFTSTPPNHVCFAGLVELEVRGFTVDEELPSLDVSVRRGVAEVLDVGEQFVG